MTPASETLPLTLKKLTETIVDDESARRLPESIRWPEGPVCPHCGEIGNADRLKPRPGSKKPGRIGLWKCYGRLEQFSVTVGTVFEDSKIPLHKWLLAAYMLCCSKKGMSAHQFHRMMEIPHKTVWFMFHRLRFGMTQHPFMEKLRGVVEIDETYVGPKERGPPADLWPDSGLLG